MKTYEEMARDVLRRRDEELLSITQTSQINPPPEVVYPAAPKKRGKRGLLPKIAIPCAAAVLVGVVGFSVWKNTHSRGYINQCIADDRQPGAPEANEGVAFTLVAEEPAESIYKGGENHISINKAKTWNVYHQPLLSEEDFRPIADERINSYYGMEFDRLSRVFPEWESSHEPFGTYEHDEDDGFVVSHAILSSANSINYKPDTGGRVTVTARYQSYCSASVDDAQPSVINGFDAMIYNIPINEEYAADIEMGNATVTIWTSYVDEYEFIKIITAYTAPDEGGEDNQNNNHNQTMEDKINILDEAPVYVNVKSWPFRLETYENLVNLEACEFIRYSMSEINDFYGINFGCLSELHPDWLKVYNERNLGVYIEDLDDIQTADMAVSGGRAILWDENTLGYQTDNGVQISIAARWSTLPAEEMGSSVINGYDAVIFRELGNNEDVWGYGAAVQMDGTLVFITATATNMSEDEFIDLVREYTSEASKYRRSSKPLPEQNESTTFTAYNSVEYEIQCEVDFSVASYWLKRIYNEKYAKKVENLRWETVGCDESLDYLSDFFESDALPVDEQYIHDLKWYISDGHFTCTTAKGAKAYTPVDGKVVAVCDGWYNGGLGNAVAVEFDNTSYFIMGHLDEVNVEVGDSVKAGDVLGVCGQTGAVVVEEDEALLSLITLVKLGD